MFESIILVAWMRRDGFSLLKLVIKLSYIAVLELVAQVVSLRSTISSKPYLVSITSESRVSHLTFMLDIEYI